MLYLPQALVASRGVRTISSHSILLPHRPKHCTYCITHLLTPLHPYYAHYLYILTLTHTSCKIQVLISGADFSNHENNSFFIYNHSSTSNSMIPCVYCNLAKKELPLLSLYMTYGGSISNSDLRLGSTICMHQNSGRHCCNEDHSKVFIIAQQTIPSR